MDNGEFAKIQLKELSYWRNTPYPPTGSWYYYDREFLPYIDLNYLTVGDFGSGPVPYFFNHNVRYREGWAIDPLIHEYVGITKYKPYYDAARADRKTFRVEKRMQGFDYGYFEAMFALNVLDHVQDIDEALYQLARVTRGRLFIYVDVDKPPDPMHPLTVSAELLVSFLNINFDPIYVNVTPSWKFDNDVLYFVGDRKE